MTFKPVKESDLPRFSHGKGDRDRTTDKQEYDENYTRIFGEIFVMCKNCKARVNTNKFTECPWCGESVK